MRRKGSCYSRDVAVGPGSDHHLPHACKNRAYGLVFKAASCKFPVFVTSIMKAASIVGDTWCYHLLHHPHQNLTNATSVGLFAALNAGSMGQTESGHVRPLEHIIDWRIWVMCSDETRHAVFASRLHNLSHLQSCIFCLWNSLEFFGILWINGRWWHWWMAFGRQKMMGNTASSVPSSKDSYWSWPLPLWIRPYTAFHVDRDWCHLY